MPFLKQVFAVAVEAPRGGRQSFQKVINFIIRLRLFNLFSFIFRLVWSFYIICLSILKRRIDNISIERMSIITITRIKIIWICWDLFCGLTYDLSCKMFPVHLRRMCILLLLDRMLHIYLLSLSDLICHLRSMFPYKFSELAWFFIE